MPISYTYNIVFIHIPKCAGTTIEKIIGTCTVDEFFSTKPVSKFGLQTTPQHKTYIELKNMLQVNWSNYSIFSVVRNPYSRFVSEYSYRKDMFNRTKKPEHDPKTFSSFVASLNIEDEQRISIFDSHLETQSSFLKNDTGFIESSIQIFNFENLEPCWTMLEGKTGIRYANYLWSRKSSNTINYQEFYTTETKELVYNFYKEDFDNFGYSPNL